jgi:hypothetical protein
VQQISTKHKDEEIEIEKVYTHQFYTGSSYNPEAVHPLTLSRDFTIITTDYKMLEDTSKRLLNNQAQLQETSML